MTTETVNILALVVACLGVLIPLYLTWRTDRLIQSEDEKAKKFIAETQRLIDEGRRETQQMIVETQRMIEEGRKETRELISYMVKILEGMERRSEERHKELLSR